MSKHLILIAIAAAALSPAWASQPGHPLDCSDWVSLEPGYSCVPVVPFPCTEDEVPWCLPVHDRNFIDNEGRIVYVQFSVPIWEMCGARGLGRLEVHRSDGLHSQLIGYISSRCVNESPWVPDQV